MSYISFERMKLMNFHFLQTVDYAFKSSLFNDVSKPNNQNKDIKL